MGVSGDPGPPGGVEATREALREAGVANRRRREVIALLTEGPHTVAALIGQSAVERRTVERILALLGGDVVTTATGELAIAPDQVPTYRALIDYPRLRATAPADPVAHLLDRHVDLVARVESWIARMPRARQALDHVSATAETAVRRAIWLDSTFDLDGARLLCIGDHDLTSLAVAAVNPAVETTVVDVDDRVLDFIDDTSRSSVRCLWSDFRYGLADGAREWGDLVFTDPPYTPEGVRLFLARGLEGLRDKGNSRMVLSYGSGAGHPGLALKVQEAVADLHLVYEEVLPAFNRYHGAQAVGSSSSLYLLRPTARSAASTASAMNIYTHGAQSLEAKAARMTDAEATALHTIAAGPAGLEVATVGDKRWPLAEVFGGRRAKDHRGLVVDLSEDPGSWLVRLLLAIDAPRLAVLVPNQHADLASQSAQRALSDLFAAKWRLRFRRSTPGPQRAVVQAEQVGTQELGTADQTVRAVLDRPHGKVANTWREGLIRASGGDLSKNDARALIDRAYAGPLGDQLVNLPRRRLAELVEGIAASARPASHPGTAQ